MSPTTARLNKTWTSFGDKTKRGLTALGLKKARLKKALATGLGLFGRRPAKAAVKPAASPAWAAQAPDEDEQVCLDLRAALSKPVARPSFVDSIWTADGLHVAAPSDAATFGDYDFEELATVDHTTDSIILGNGPMRSTSARIYDRMNAGALNGTSVSADRKGYAIAGYRREVAPGDFVMHEVYRNPDGPGHAAGDDGYNNGLNLRTLFEQEGAYDGTQLVEFRHIAPGSKYKLFRREAPQSAKRFYRGIYQEGTTTFVTLTEPHENQSPRYASRTNRPRRNHHGHQHRPGVGTSYGNASPNDFYEVDRHHVKEGFLLNSVGEKKSIAIDTEGGPIHTHIREDGLRTGDMVVGGPGIDSEFARRVKIHDLSYVNVANGAVEHRVHHVETNDWVDNTEMTGEKLLTLTEIIRAVNGQDNAGQNPLSVNCIFGHGRTGVQNMCLFLAECIDARIQQVVAAGGDPATVVGALTGGGDVVSSEVQVQLNRMIGIYRAMTMSGAVARNKTCDQPKAVSDFAVAYARRATQMCGSRRSLREG